MKMHSDSFITYMTRVTIVIVVGSGLLMFGLGLSFNLQTLLVIFAEFAALAFLTAIIIDKSCMDPVKFYSPVPVKLDRWRFVFYIVEGSRIVNSEDLLLEHLNK